MKFVRTDNKIFTPTNDIDPMTGSPIFECKNGEYSTYISLDYIVKNPDKFKSLPSEAEDKSIPSNNQV